MTDFFLEISQTLSDSGTASIVPGDLTDLTNRSNTVGCEL